MENADLAYKTRDQYTYLLKRINEAIGHIPLNRLTADHIQEFYRNLREPDLRQKYGYCVAKHLREDMQKQKITSAALSEKANLAKNTIRACRNGSHVTAETANAVAIAMGKPVEKLFHVYRNDSRLSGKTMLHYHRLIKTILHTAHRRHVVEENVAELVDAPKVRRKEAQYYDDEEAQAFVGAVLEEEDIRKKAALLTLIFAGVRIGELCGLSWEDVNFRHETIAIRRASQFQSGSGMVEVPTKTEKSERIIDVPSILMTVLKQYRVWWDDRRASIGEGWKGTGNRVFITEDGQTINSQTINKWLDAFISRHGFKRLTPHGLRHTFASLQLANGVDVRTLQERGGWSDAMTLLHTYAHALRSKQKEAANILENVLVPGR